MYTVLNMSLPRFVLIGFLAFTVCHSFCPMNTAAAAMEHDHDLHMAHMHMDHESEDAGCDHCEEYSDEELALTNVVPVPTIQPSLVAIIILGNYSIVEESVVAVTQTHLAAADPPIAAHIVSTIVLRT